MSDHSEEEVNERIHPFDQMFFGNRKRTLHEQTNDHDHNDENLDNENENEGSFMDDFFSGFFKKKI